MKPKVLIVDDEAFSAAFLEEFLGEQFAFDYAGSGEEALATVARSNPTVILMDVEMPNGMNGYQACRALRDNPATHSIPVIFISAHSQTEDRLNAYEAGGDDYVSKPLNIEELKYKIELARANQERRNELADNAQRATSVALMSMREAADAGVVLGFLSAIVQQTDLADIANTALRVLQQFQIEGAVQLRNGQAHISRNTAGVCSPVEDAVLSKMASDARIVDLGPRSAFNFDRASIIIYNMPADDANLYGRLKDTVLKIAEALDVRMRSLALVAAASGDTGVKLSERNAAILQDIDACIIAQREEGLHIMQHYVRSIDGLMATLGLTEPQKTRLRDVARETQNQLESNFNAAETAHLMQALLSGSDQTLVKEGVVPVTTATPLNNNVELF